MNLHAISTQSRCRLGLALGTWPKKGGSARTEDAMGFVQVIEIISNRRGEIDELVAAWREQTEGRRLARRATLTEDRDRPGTYVQMVEFDSYEEAMANSALPETALFAKRLAELCDQPPTFRNLDVLLVEEL
jgi:hypothetical protein